MSAGALAAKQRLRTTGVQLAVRMVNGRRMKVMTTWRMGAASLMQQTHVSRAPAPPHAVLEHPHVQLMVWLPRSTSSSRRARDHLTPHTCSCSCSSTCALWSRAWAHWRPLVQVLIYTNAMSAVGGAQKQTFWQNWSAAATEPTAVTFDCLSQCERWVSLLQFGIGYQDDAFNLIDHSAVHGTAPWGSSALAHQPVRNPSK